MKAEVLFRKSISIFTIIALLMAEFVVIGQNIVNAMTNEELENQSNSTNVSNVYFDAYFKDGENTTHSKESDLDEEETLIVNINVKNTGSIENGKIKINNPNFKIEKEKISNQYVKDVNSETNEIELNKIIYQNDAKIEVPVTFKKQVIFTEDYFEKETSIQLTGTYKQDEQSTDITGEVKVKNSWKQATDVALEQNIEKYINVGQNTIIQQSVTTTINNNKLPRQNEIITVQAIEIDNTKPTEVTVLLNGGKLDSNSFSYNEEDGIITINNTEHGYWGDATNRYKIIYKYSNMEFINRNIKIKASVQSKLYTQDVINKQDEQDIEIQEKGKIITASKVATPQIYKGYMYANSTNETTYQESNTIEISDVDSIDNIKMETTNSYFTNENSTKYDANNINIFKTTSINKSKFVEYFGTDGYIDIKDNNGVVIQRIDNNTEANENGIIVINYDGEKTDIKIETSKPIKQGEFTIQNTKAIKSVTGYNKNTLKNINKLYTNEKISTDAQSSEAEVSIDLLDTKTEAKLDINNVNLSTLQNNENVQFLITLLSNSEQYDLYKNPEIYITIPKEININVKTMQQLNLQDELSIESTGIKTLENGEKLIRISLKGEQKSFVNAVDNGIQIAFMADMSTENTVPTQDTKISMRYTNENRAGETLETEQNIKLNSKYGILTVNKITDFNNNGDEINSITNTVENAKLDEQVNARTLSKTVNIVNNYGKNVDNMYYIGQIAGIDSISNFEMKLASDIKVSKENIKIYYSEDANANKDSNTWKEDANGLSKIRAFKVEIGTMNPAENVEIKYNVDIPANLTKNKKTYLRNIINYDYDGNANNEVSAVIFATEQTEKKVIDNISEENTNNNANNVETNTSEENQERISLNVKAFSGEKEIKDGDTVTEGQGITYQLAVKNNTNNEIKNVKIKATNDNAIYYDTIVRSENINDEMMDIYHIEENEELKSKDLTIETLKPGETSNLEYQISVKEVEGNDQKLTGKIAISADGIETKELKDMTNNIEKGNIKLTIRNQYSEEVKTYTGDLIEYAVNVKNISKSLIEETIVEVPISENVSFDPEYIKLANSSDYEYIGYENGIVKFKVKSLEVNETRKINLAITAKTFDVQETEKYILEYCTSTLNGRQYISNNVIKTIYQKETKIDSEQTSNVVGTTVSNGDNIQFRFNIINSGKIEKSLEFVDNIQEGLNINEAYLIKKGQKVELEDYNRMIIYDMVLEAEEEVQIVIDTTLNLDMMENSQKMVSNVATIKGENVDVTTNTLEYKIKERTEPTEPTNPDKPTNPEQPDNPDTPNKPSDSKYSISGQAWLDSNGNGQKDSTEHGINGITVSLMEEQTGNIVKEQITQNDGNYEFANIKKGNYIVIFKYDTTKYSVTEYKKSGINEGSNSDVVSKKMNLNNAETVVGATETLNLNSNLSNIDAGFKENKIFDLKLDKYINKVEIKNSTGVQIASYDKEKLAKVEIAAKQLDNSTVTVEYQIEVTNEGEIPGYANEIIDYIPSDLTFSKELNKDWNKNSDGTVTSTNLKNTIINAGETKTLTLVLTKKMTKDTTGTSINIAEIKESSNDYAIEDKDSIAGNKKDKEDDMSSAQLIISVKTGTTIAYIGLSIMLIITLGAGLYFIKAKVLKK